MNKILEELNGKVVGIESSFFCEGEQCVKILDYDENYLKILTATNITIIIPHASVIYIEPEGDIVKFEEYLTKFKLDPNFLGDIEDNFIKKNDN